MTRDLVCGSLGLVLALVYYAAAASVPVSLLSDAVGPGGIPKALAVSLGVLSAALIGSQLAVRRTEGPPDVGDEAGIVGHHLRAFGLVVIGFVYVGIAPLLGYPVAIALLIGVTVVYFGLRPNWRLVAIAASGAVLFWALFAKLLGVPMPLGFWSRLVV